MSIRWTSVVFHKRLKGEAEGDAVKNFRYVSECFMWFHTGCKKGFREASEWFLGIHVSFNGFCEISWGLHQKVHEFSKNFKKITGCFSGFSLKFRLVMN